jgi:hypothetical protein
MVVPLAPRRRPRTDDSDSWLSLSKAYQQQPLLVRMPDDDLAMLVLRMVKIVVNSGERIRENGNGFLEGDAMILEIFTACCGSHSNSRSICARERTTEW